MRKNVTDNFLAVSTPRLKPSDKIKSRQIETRQPLTAPANPQNRTIAIPTPTNCEAKNTRLESKYKLDFFSGVHVSTPLLKPSDKLKSRQIKTRQPLPAPTNCEAKNVRLKPEYNLEYFDGAHNVLECLNDENGTELTLMQSPYLVQRPKIFPSSALSVTVLWLRGIRDETQKRPKDLYMRLRVNDKVHTTGFINTERRTYRKAYKRNTFSFPIIEMRNNLIIEVVHHRRSRMDRVLSTVHFPLQRIEPCNHNTSLNYGNTGTHDAKRPLPTEIEIPCELAHTNGQKGSVLLSIVFTNSFRWWLKRELEERSKTKQTYSVRTSSSGKVKHIEVLKSKARKRPLSRC